MTDYRLDKTDYKDHGRSYKRIQNHQSQPFKDHWTFTRSTLECEEKRRAGIIDSYHARKLNINAMGLQVKTFVVSLN